MSTFKERQHLIKLRNNNKVIIKIYSIERIREKSKKGNGYDVYIISYKLPGDREVLAKRFVSFSDEGKMIDNVLVDKIFTNEWLTKGLKALVTFGMNDEGFKVWKDLKLL